tara:strand:- start:68 stop:388 length:321 start_codon:yes stop_codon:yes gene_type:complete
MKKIKYGVTNQLTQIAKAPARQPEYRVNKLGQKIGATGLTLIEQMGAADASRHSNNRKQNRMIKNSNPNRGQYMDGGMAKKKMMKGGRSMYSAGGNASVMPKATPN